MAKLKKPVLYALVAVGVGGALFGVKAMMDAGIIPKPAMMAAKAPEKQDTFATNVVDKPTQTYQLTAAPGSDLGGCPTALIIPWQAEGALTLANGGPKTTPDSLMHQYAGGCLNIQRQDDYGVMAKEMVKFAAAYKPGSGVTPSEGAPIIMIMGDGLPGLAVGLVPAMAKYHQDISVIGVTGFSYGEDKCMAPPTGGDPKKAEGDVIAAVARDGDWNICVKWAGDNGIPINTDNSVFDPGAINFVDTDSFVQADDKFVAGACEDRVVAHNGVKTSEHRHVCVNGVATWTPGDVVVVKANKGVVALASTRDYTQQMPAVIIVNKQWAAEHKAFIVGLLRASDRAAFQIRTGDGLGKMAAIHAQIFGAAGGEEADPSYWAKYFTGEETTDSQGNKVYLGGSRVSTLAEVRDFFGMGTGTFNVYKGVYNVFGNYDKEFYPSLVPSYPKYDKVVDTSYIAAALDGTLMTAPSAAPFAEAKTIQTKVSKRAFHIEFETGKATITPASVEKLFEIANQSGMTSLRIQIDGHTDNTGSSTINTGLSRARAQAVADWLNQQAPNTFPQTRMEVRGYGDSTPVASNDTADGRAQNRRVEITLGN